MQCGLALKCMANESRLFAALSRELFEPGNGLPYFKQGTVRGEPGPSAYLISAYAVHELSPDKAIA